MIEFEQDHDIALVLDEALGLFDHHLGDLDMALRRFVEGRADHFAAHRARHVGHLLGPLIDQQHDQIDFRVIGRDRMGDVLQHHRLAGARRRHDQRPLALAERRDQVDDPGRQILACRVVEFERELLFGVERGQIVEIDPLAQAVGLIKIDRIHLEEREIALAVARRTDLALDRIAGAQPKAANLARADIDVVGPRQVIGFRRSKKSKPVGKDFEHAVAGNRYVVLGQLLQNREQHVLLAQRGRILDFQLFGKSEELRRGFTLQFL